jgi:hypothetical protein
MSNVLPTGAPADTADRDPLEAAIRAEFDAAGYPPPLVLRYVVAVELVDPDGTGATRIVHGRSGHSPRASAELLTRTAAWMTRHVEGGELR